MDFFLRLRKAIMNFHSRIIAIPNARTPRQISAYAISPKAKISALLTSFACTIVTAIAAAESVSAKSVDVGFIEFLDIVPEIKRFSKS
jgi:hypothetical protein